MASDVLAAEVEEEILSQLHHCLTIKLWNILNLVTDDLKLVTANPHV
jgi:hypothetical protein